MKMKKKNEREKKKGNEKEEEATFFAIHKWINERSIVCSHGNHRRMIVAHKGSGVKKSHFENVMLVWCIVILHAQDSDVMLIRFQIYWTWPAMETWVWVIFEHVSNMFGSYVKVTGEVQFWPGQPLACRKDQKYKTLKKHLTTEINHKH